MKTLRYILLSVAVASLASACSDDLNPDGPANKAEKGDEVRFTMTLPGAETRTIYGEENKVDKSFPIYWVNGDLVQVCSPQCLSGRNNAEYSISAGEKQNYATSMTHTGENGVQWGESATADFYSVYPSDAAALNIINNNVTASLGIAASQTAKLNPDLTTSTDSVYQPEDMKNVIMVAKTTEVPSGNDVVLRYIPFSTVIEFEINGPSDGTAGAATEMIVQTLTLTAPTGTNIAGKFKLALNDMPATSNISDFSESNTFYAKEVTGGSNEINLHLIDDHGAYATVSAKKKLKVKMCLIPQPYTSIEGWTVKITTPAGNYTKTIKDYTVSEGKSNNLAAGMVHKVQLPPLNYNAGWTYNTNNWITSLPDYKNIYLSELSLPGAWYAGTPLVSGWGADENENYQITVSISDLWNAGVRAFAVETKTVTPERTGGFLSYTYYENPEGVAISGTQRNGGSKSVGTNSLNPDSNSKTGDVSCIQSSTKKIETLISDIAGNVKDDEYAVLVLSYADGGSSGLRYVDFGAWLQLLYDAYNGITDTDIKNKIYTGEITKNTTVNDVLGKLILKINIDQNIAMWGKVGDYSYSYKNNLPALFSYNPFLSQMGTNPDFTAPYYSPMYWKSWSDTYNGVYTKMEDNMAVTDDFLWVFSSANRTDCTGNTNSNGVPTIAQRQTALESMMTYSKEIYDASTHNVWFYFNCGGTSTTSSEGSGNANEFASNMNSWLLGKINAKTDASPLGIVMFNRCTEEANNGPAIIKAIIEMNSKFYLKHAGTSGNGTGGTTYSGDSPVTSGGSAF